jgi:hypothetical protein
VYPAPLHEGQLHLPPDFDYDNPGVPPLRARPHPLKFFKLMFMDIIFDELAVNTNAYASKAIGESLIGRDKSWKPTSGMKLKIFIGILIYMGLYRSSKAVTRDF